MLTVVVWKWQQPGFRVGYSAEIVDAMREMVARHYKQPHRFICITDDPTGVTAETFPLWADCSEMSNACGKHLPSCYRRLRLFSRKTTDEMGIALGSRVVSLDLDMVITADLTPLFERPERFIGWRVPGTRHAHVFNGSMWLFQAGKFDWLWDEFSPAKSPMRANDAGYFGSDQAWISYRLAGGEAGWTAQDGVYSFTRDIMRSRMLPRNTRVVSFNGKRKPWGPEVRQMAPWIVKYYPYAAPLPPQPAPERFFVPEGRLQRRRALTAGTSMRGR